MGLVQRAVCQPWAKGWRGGWGLSRRERKKAFHNKRVESSQITVLLICSVMIAVSCVLLFLPDKNNLPHFCYTV